MIGSFLTRGLVLIFGYAYPAYECYKTVEMNRPEIEQLRFWCQYWILVAVLTVCERIGDTFISWVPMYSEAKLMFFIYLWYPKTKGTAYVYESFFRPYVAQHETEIDRNLFELRTRAGDMAVQYWQRAASYGQTRFFEILQYIAAQSTPTPTRSPLQQPQQGTRGRQPAGVPKRQTSNGPNRQPAASSKPELATPSQLEAEEPPSPTSSTTSSQHQKEVEVEVGPSEVLKADPSAATLTDQVVTVESNSSSLSAPPQAEATLPPPINDSTNPPLQETIMEETIRVTRARLRRAQAAANQ